MNRFGHMKFADNKIAEVNEKVDQTKLLMQDNVKKVMDRGGNALAAGGVGPLLTALFGKTTSRI